MIFLDTKKLQKKIDKALAVLSDHDDKRGQDRYKKLQSAIEEAQEYIDNGNHSNDMHLEYFDILRKSIKEFEEDRFIFMVFLTILSGLLFIGVFYITYSHFYDQFHPGKPIRPPYHTSERTDKTSTTHSSIITDSTSTTKSTHRTSTRTSSTRRTSRRTSSTRRTSTTHSTSSVTTDKTTSSTTKTTSKVTTSQGTTSTVTTTTKVTTTTPIIDPSPSDMFVTVIFDNSSLIDLDNVYPMLDSDGVNTKPTTWRLSSELSQGSKDYVITYTIDFVDMVDDIPVNKRLNPNDLNYHLLIKKSGSTIYDSGVQDMYDYPEAEEGIRPIITSQTYNNNETLDFELRMWLKSSVGNSEQGKKYRFDISVSAYYEFCDNGIENGVCK